MGLRRLLSGLRAILVAIPSQAAFALDGSTLPQDRGKSAERSTASGAVADPFTGAATYSIPILLPPGTGGMTPQLALTYSSQGTVDSWVGSRWSLGLPAIERSLSRGVPTYNDAVDVFQFAGQDLVPDGSTTGLFHTERESFLRIVREAGDGSWTVTRKDGTVLRFGTSSASRVQNATGTRVLQWLIAEQEDVHGNVIQFNYQTGGDDGAQYPHQIVYTLRRSGSGLESLGVDRVVEFQLDPAVRPDPSHNYAAGFLRKISRRLLRVKVSIGSDLVRSYELSYVQYTANRRSLLAAVGLLGSNGNAQPPLTTAFAYDSAGTETGWSTSNDPWTFPSSFHFVDNDTKKRDAGWRLADVNGDGLPDLIKYVANWDLATGSITFDSDNGVYLNSGAGWSTAPSSTLWPLPQAANPLQSPFFAVRIQPSAGPDTVQPTGRAVLDATGDGRADFLAWTNYVVPFDDDDVMGLPAGAVAAGLYRGPWWKSKTVTPSSEPGRWDAITPAIESDPVYQSNVWFATHGVGITGSTTLGGNVRFAERNGDGLIDIAVAGYRLNQQMLEGWLDPCLGSGGSFWIRNNGSLDFSITAGSAGHGQPVVPQWAFELQDGSHSRISAYAPHVCEGVAFNEGASVDPFSFSLFTDDPELANFEVVNDGLREMVDVNGDGLDDQLTAYDQYSSYKTYQWGFPTGVIITEHDADEFRRGARLNIGGVLSSSSSAAFAPPIAFVEIQAEQNNASSMNPYSLDNGARFTDVDGDGRTDLVRRRGGGGGDNKTWLNDGHGSGGSAWIESESWDPPFNFVDGNSRDLGVRLVDVDGNGMVDIVEARPGSRRVRLNRAEVPDLLTRITRPDGGTTSISYSPSTRFSHLGNDDLPDLPMVMQLVHEVAVDDANPANGTQPAVTTYSYANGYYDSAARKFRGFGRVSVTRPDGRVTTTEYHQSASRVGLPKNTLVQFPDGQGGLRDWRYQGFVYSSDTSAPYVILLSSVRTEERDGNGGNRTSLTEFDHDTYGNQVAVHERGQIVGTSDVDPMDNRFREVVYALPNSSAHLVDRPAIERLWGGTLGDTLLSERHFLYDCNPSSCPGNPLSQAPPTRGLVTKRVDVLADPVRPDPVTTFTYDEYGNLTSTTDPRANAFEGGGTSTIQYDTVFHAFPTLVTNAAGHQRTFTYAPSGSCSGMAGAVPHSAGEGLVYEERGANDLANGASHWLRCYDRFGRPILERAPNTLAQTTRSYVDTFPASITERVAATSTAATGSRTSTTYLDGLSRPIRATSDAAQGRTATVETVYDDVGRVKSETAPFFGAPLTKPTTSYLYDPLDRLIERKLPGLSGTRRETTTYAQGLVTHIDANGRMTERLFDPFGNLREVVEHNGGSEYTTRYEYDARNLLTRVIDHGANETRIVYDQLGRRKSIEDPDTGPTLFEFDSNGNLVRREAATGTFLVWFYDALDRPVARHVNGNTNPDVTWQYDAATNGIGLLARRDDAAGRYQAQAYDLLGRPTQEERATSGTTSYILTFATSYSLEGSLNTRTYPNGRIVEWVRDGKGFLTEIRSGADAYATAIDWEAQGRVKAWTAGNGVATTYSFDAATTRLDRIQVGSLEDLEYEYDAGDRITSITDNFDGAKSRSFGYDDLDRLDQASGPFGPGQTPISLFYAYDPIGNLTCKGATSLSGCTNGVLMTYPTSGPTAVRPHAPSTVGGVTVEYAEDGNLTDDGPRSFQYHPIGKMSRVIDGNGIAATFTYDGSDELSLISDRSTGSAQNRWLLAADFEWNQTTQQAKIQISLGDSIAATETDAYSPSSGGGGSCSGIGPGIPIDLDRFLANLLLAFTLLGLSVIARSRPRHAWRRATTALACGVALFVVTSFPTPIGMATVDPAYAALQQVEFYHADAIGSSVLVTNEAGAVVQRTVYEPYGRVVAPSGGPTNAPEFGFTNQRFIKRAEIYDYGARMYDPRMGRFLQPDSIVPDPSDPQSLNRYSYVRNSPTNRIDPTGNEDQWWYGGYTGGYNFYIDWLLQNFTLGSGLSRSSLEDGSFDWAAAEDAALTVGLEAANSRSPVDLLSFYGIYRNYANMTSILQQGVGWAGAPSSYRAPFEQALLQETASLTVNTASVMTTAAGGALGGTLRGAAGVAVASGAAEYVARGVAAESRAFGSYSAFRRAMGSAGEGREWHHIVEQTRNNIGRFGPESIHNTANVVPLDVATHRRVSALYSSIRPDITGSTSQTVRQWLSTQSYDASRSFGLRVMENIEKGTWP